MKKIVSFCGGQSKTWMELNQRAGQYAGELGMAYHWAPQKVFSEKTVIAEMQHADAAIIDIEPYGDTIFSQIKDSVRLLIRFGVGYDQVDLKTASSYGLAVARTTAANTTAVAEMAVMLALNARRKFMLYQETIKAGRWNKAIGHEMIGSTVGILGFGVIGQYLAKMLRGFECNILVYDPFPKEEVLAEYQAQLVGLEELFQQSDVISIHTPYCPETHHLVDAHLLGLMKKEAVLVNTARGNLVDESALYEVLKKGHIAGAAFDVFAVEPLPEDSPLRNLENMILTPHAASQTVESLWNIYKVAIEIAADFFAGKDSKHILNPDYKENAGLKNR